MHTIFQSKFRMVAYCVLLILQLSSCKNRSKTNIIYYDNDQIKELKVTSVDGKISTYTFYINGALESINRFDKQYSKSGEQLLFYQSGILNRKVSFLKDEINGSAYYYYDTTGAVKHFRYFKDGKQILFGVDYWNDSIGVIKSSLHFNNNGEVFYKKNFNRTGEVIGEEGTRN